MSSVTHPAGAFDVIIPARNEEATVGAVVRAALAARGRGRVIVVDDGSSDATAAAARAAGAEVIASGGSGSKARALAAGVAACVAPPPSAALGAGVAAADSILLFFDADILDARPEHFEQLAAPVLDDGFSMCCGLVDYGALRGALFARLPPITGLRALRREVFAAIPAERLNGFQIEIMINEVVARAGSRTAIRTLAGAGHRSKVRKLGMLPGVRAHASMTAELLHCLTFVPLWTYRSYLSNLTIL
jgi:glycosyltransferase involved in cell wall biosynthesis